MFKYMTSETRERMDSIKTAAIQGGQAGLSIGVILGTFSYVFAGRIPLFRGRMQTLNLPTYMALGGMACCSVGAAISGRDFFTYAWDVLQKGPEIDPDVYAADRMISQITSYQSIMHRNDREIVDRFDVAFENRRKAIEQYNLAKSQQISQSAHQPTPYAASRW